MFDRSQMGGWANSIKLMPGRDGTEKPFGTVTSTRFSTTDVWLNDQNADFDIAAIHLDTPVGEERGWFQIASLEDDVLQGFMVNVSGYPGDRGGGTEQWWARNRIRAVTQRRIFYDVDTFGGQSGGPAFIIEQEGAPPVVVGIHAYGTGGTPASIPFTVNSAPRIIPEVVEKVQEWIDQDNQGG